MAYVAFFIKRFFQAIGVMFVISLIGFSIQGNLGDPLQEMVGISVSEQEREILREELGLNDPFLVQYGRFIKKAVQGDLGTSYFFKKPALEVILDKFPATIDLVIGASIIILGVSIPFGCYCAIRPRSWLAKVVMGVSIIGISVPVFLTAIFCIYLFSVTLGWLPSFGRGEELVEIFPGWKTGLFTLTGLKHLLLPSFALSSIMLPLFIRLIRSEMMEVLEQDYIKFAWAKGLAPRRVWLLHAFKNTLLPVVTVGGVQIGVMLAYTILTETVFQWPGLGFMFIEAVNRVDTPLIIAYIIVVGLIFVATNTIVDLLYTIINPMVRIVGKG